MPAADLPVMNQGLYLARAAQTYPDHVGFIRGEARVTYRDMEQAANALAHAFLEMGVVKGDRIAIMCPNDRHIIESQFAVLRSGGVYNPLNFRASNFETGDYCRRAHAKILIIHGSLVERANAAAEASPELRHVITTSPVPEVDRSAKVGWHDYAALVDQYQGRPLVNVPVTFDDHCWHYFTSGTTGVPKGSIMTHGRLAFTFANRICDVLPGLGHQDVMLAIGPISHGTGTLTTLHVIKAGTIVVLDQTSFDPERALALIQKHRVTNIFTVPTILMDLLNHPNSASYDITSLKAVVLAGAPISRADQKIAIERLGRVLVQYYGLAENMGTSTVLYPHMHSLDEDDPLAPPGSCGVARTGMEVAIMDERMTPLPPGEIGEICTKGIGNFWGYYEMPEATAETIVDGWVRSGDLGRMDERGFVYIQGRSKEMYKSGGLQVYPRELEHHLALHPGVQEAHVVSFPDSRWGETGVAVVQLKTGATTTETELLGYIGERLSRYKRPRRIFIWSDIPRTSYGKVPKQLLRDVLGQREGIVAGQDIPNPPTEGV
jgi:acyl-CoA synthetase (AMP-forming)/AMP-acid ligase II